MLRRFFIIVRRFFFPPSEITSEQIAAHIAEHLTQSAAYVGGDDDHATHVKAYSEYNAKP